MEIFPFNDKEFTNLGERYIHGYILDLRLIFTAKAA
jgi:hypothetical protein